MRKQENLRIREGGSQGGRERGREGGNKREDGREREESQVGENEVASLSLS